MVSFHWVIRMCCVYIADVCRVYVWCHGVGHVCYVYIADVCRPYVWCDGVGHAGLCCTVDVRWSQRDSLHHCTVSVSVSLQCQNEKEKNNYFCCVQLWIFSFYKNGVVFPSLTWSNSEEVC